MIIDFLYLVPNVLCNFSENIIFYCVFYNRDNLQINPDIFFQIWSAMLITSNIGSGKSTIVVRNDDIFSDGDSHPPEEVEIVVRMATDNNIPQCTTETNPISAPATAPAMNGRTTLLTTTGMVISTNYNY